MAKKVEVSDSCNVSDIIAGLAANVELPATDRFRKYDHIHHSTPEETATVIQSTIASRYVQNRKLYCLVEISSSIISYVSIYCGWDDTDQTIFLKTRSNDSKRYETCSVY